MKRLVLIDGHAILHRAYHAIPILTSSGGQLTNAVYGFLLMLLKVIQDLSPTHVTVAFDLPAPTFRQEVYITYQAHRPSMDQTLKDQIETVYEVVKKAGIPIYTATGFEADDVIGTLAKQAVKTQNRVDEVVIVTGDRDILQLVNKKVKVYMPIRGLSDAKLFDEKAVEEYMGIKPSQIVDYKALVGDSSDNYPGVPGIGPKTAITLLKDFGSLETIYSAAEHKMRNARRIPPKVLEKLESGYEGAILSQKLAKIVCNVPVEFDFKKAELKDFKNNEKFIGKLRELGFKSLIAKVIGNSDPNSSDGQMGLL